MLHSFSFGELALVFGIIIVLFGGSRLASVGKSLGEGIANFKKGLNTTAEEKNSVPTSEAKVQVVHHNVQIQSPQNSQSTAPINQAEHLVDARSYESNKG